jgi:hypothetical protein
VNETIPPRPRIATISISRVWGNQIPNEHRILVDDGLACPEGRHAVLGALQEIRPPQGTGPEAGWPVRLAFRRGGWPNRSHSEKPQLRGCLPGPHFRAIPGSFLVLAGRTEQPPADVFGNGAQALIADLLAVRVGDVRADVPHDVADGNRGPGLGIVLSPTTRAGLAKMSSRDGRPHEPARLARQSFSRCFRDG